MARIAAQPLATPREQLPALEVPEGFSVEVLAEAYLRKALGDYRSGARVGVQAAMAEALSGLGEEGLAALAHFLAHYDG